MRKHLSFVGLACAPGIAMASGLECRLRAVAGSAREAIVVIEKPRETTAKLSITGTHRDPERMDRRRPETRVYTGTNTQPNGEWAVTFEDGGTVGVFSMDYWRKAGLSLHIVEVDRMYFEQFVGFCEGAN